MIVFHSLLLLFALGSAVGEDVSDDNDDFAHSLANALEDIGVNLTAIDQEAIVYESSGLEIDLGPNWKLSQWPLMKHGNDTKRKYTNNPLGPRTLDGYLDLLIERQAQLNTHLPGASHSLNITKPWDIKAGKLRYVENSGVCGMLSSIYSPHSALIKHGQRPLLGYIKLRDMQTFLIRVICGRTSLAKVMIYSQ